VSWARTWGRAESRIGLAFAVVLMVCNTCNQGRPGRAGTAAGSIGPKLGVELTLAREGAGEGQKPSPLFEAYLT
jgi:hypothetical protein